VQFLDFIFVGGVSRARCPPNLEFTMKPVCEPIEG
jgi:hypothetical protein